MTGFPESDLESPTPAFLKMLRRIRKTACWPCLSWLRMRSTSLSVCSTLRSWRALEPTQVELFEEPVDGGLPFQQRRCISPQVKPGCFSRAVRMSSTCSSSFSVK